MDPHHAERLEEEQRGLLARLLPTSIIYSVNYEFDKDGDFLIHFSTSAETKEYVICLQLISSPSLSWKETRLIKECLNFCERFNDVNDLRFVAFSELMKMKELVSSGSADHQDISGKAVFVLTLTAGDAVISQPAKGTILCARLSKDDGQFTVNFRTDVEEFSFSVRHKFTNGSFGMLEARALADVVFIAECGDKMDKSIFLQWCARLKAKFHVIGVSESGIKLAATIIPTALQGISPWPSFPLPTITKGHPDWSNETKARIGDAEKNSMDQERIDEVQRAAANTSDVVCFLRYEIDDKGLRIQLETGSEPKEFAVLIRLKDPLNLTWKESRVLSKVLTFCERFSAFSKPSLQEFLKNLEEKGTWSLYPILRKAACLLLMCALQRVD